MKRAWKPLSVGGMRLYKVGMRFHKHPEWNVDYIVVATRPMHAAQLIKDIYKNTEWTDGEPHFFGEALDIYMPKQWWDEGIPER